MKGEFENKEMERPPSNKQSPRIFSYDSVTTKECEGEKKHPTDPWDSKLLSSSWKKRQGAWIWLRDILRLPKIYHLNSQWDPLFPPYFVDCSPSLRSFGYKNETWVLVPREGWELKGSE